MKILKIKTLKKYGERPLTKVRMFIHWKNESVMDSLYRRQLGPHRFYRTLILPDALRKLNLPVETKAKWNKYAGCSACPCSPGFLLDLHPDEVGYEAIYVTISGK